MLLCLTELDFLKIIFFAPQNWENKLSRGFFECIGKFSFKKKNFKLGLDNESLY